jgi:hypothetical protein
MSSSLLMLNIAHFEKVNDSKQATLKIKPVFLPISPRDHDRFALPDNREAL